MAQTNTSRNGSSGSLNFVSRSSFTIRCRCGVMSKPFSLNSATSFCACETTTAMSVVFIQLKRVEDGVLFFRRGLAPATS